MPDERRAETLWAWVEEATDGTVGQIVVFHAVLGLGVTLTHRSRDIAVNHLRALAQAHADNSGHAVWLREYRMVEDHEKL